MSECTQVPGSRYTFLLASIPVVCTGMGDGGGKASLENIPEQARLSWIGSIVLLISPIPEFLSPVFPVLFTDINQKLGAMRPMALGKVMLGGGGWGGQRKSWQ